MYIQMDELPQQMLWTIEMSSIPWLGTYARTYVGEFGEQSDCRPRSHADQQLVVGRHGF